MRITTFKRSLYKDMLQWKTDRKGSTALLIKGARRVGKSTLVRTFASQEYESHLFIDFAEASEEVRHLFDNLHDIDTLLFRLQFLYNVTLTPRKSVIVFDEVQMCPRARQAIKQLVHDGRFDYIETGSLMSIKKNTQNILIPSEETRLTLYPMTYDEFRQALGDSASVPLIHQAWDKRMSLGDDVVRKMLRDMRLYMLVGGMPQAVNAYIETGNLQLVDQVKREIIELYADDFRKIDPRGVATRMFYSIPALLNSNAMRYKVGTAVGEIKTDRLFELVQDMEDSHVVLVSHHANDPMVGLSLHENYGKFKLYLADTGLFVTLAFWDKSATENIIYQKLLSDKLPADLGYVYENLVAQILTANGNRLFYHTWPSPTSNHNYEIDFLLSSANKVIPIEVKSSGYKTHASLDAFCEKFSGRVSDRYLLYTKDLRKDGPATLIPMFMAVCL